MKWLFRLVKFSIFLALLGGVGAISVFLYIEPNLPSTANLRDVELQVPLRIFSLDRKLIAEFGEKRRIPLRYDQIPKPLVQAFLAAEDDRFFEHPGVDYQGILRAVLETIRSGGERKQGGSTITMQVARNFYLSPEKTLTRKLTEILLSLRIEKELTKEEILELYLNKIYLGNRAYGVGAAAQVYYGKEIDDLDLAQIAMVAGLPKAPSRYNPIVDPERALERRNYVLGRMRKLDFIDEAAYQQALNAPLTEKIHHAEIEVEAPYVAEMVRAEMAQRYGEEATYTTGLQVITTIDSRLQTTANKAVRQGLQEYDVRHGYHGPERHVDLAAHKDQAAWDRLLAEQGKIGDLAPALVTTVEEKQITAYVGNKESLTIDWEGLKWAQRYLDFDHRGAVPKNASAILKPGDLIRVRQRTGKKGEPIGWRLAEVPTAQGAFVALDPDDGALRALVGGYDFYHSKFNRATQALRQPGSGFKPFVYSAALDNGFTPATIINDAPIMVDEAGMKEAWRPENYGGDFKGPMRLRVALATSRNLVSIRVLQALGVEKAVERAALFGFDPKDLPKNLTLVLGTANLPPLKMAEGYAVFANGGYKVQPHFLEHIENNRHETVFQNFPQQVCPECEQAAQRGEAVDSAVVAPRVITPQNWYLMNSLLREVVQAGTATKAKVLGRNDLAGKTGTTNDQRDAWFNGFQRSLVGISWVGFDDNSELGKGEVGGQAALPAWIEFMRVALEGIPEQPLEMPSGIERVRVDPQTGVRVASGGIFEVFQKDSLPPDTPQDPSLFDTPASIEATNGKTLDTGEIF